jgi:spermidine synthase
MDIPLPEGTTIRLLLVQCQCAPEWLAHHQPILPLVTQAVVDCEMTAMTWAGYDFPEAGHSLCVILAESHLAIHTYPEQSQSVMVELTVCDHLRTNRHRAHQLARRMIGIFAPQRFVLEPSNMRPGAPYLTEGDAPWANEPLIHVPLLLHPHPRSAVLCSDGDDGLAQEALRHRYLERMTVINSREGAFQLARGSEAQEGPPSDLEAWLSLRSTDRCSIPAAEEQVDLVLLDFSRGADLCLLTQLRSWVKPHGLLAFRFSDEEGQISQLAEILRLQGETPRFYWQHMPSQGLTLFGLLGWGKAALPELQTLAARVEERGLQHLRIVTPVTISAMFALPPLLCARLAPFMVS